MGFWGSWTDYTDWTSWTEAEKVPLNNYDNRNGQYYSNDDNISYYYYYGDGYNTDDYGGLSGLTGQNKNPNRYIINATSLTTDNYIIGDSRTSYINNNLSDTNESTNPASWSLCISFPTT